MSSKLFNFVLGLTFASFVAAGCAVPDKSHIQGCLMLDVGHEGRVVAHDGKVNSTKSNRGTQSSILGWITSGDSSIEAARGPEGEKINQISHIDYHASHILGLIGDCTTIVYGQ
tara:strand:+ start:369 stop:710 length:342 start_codon:yes stop_codon:yes gene_type:complete